ncbi:MAG: AAA family ATPase [Chitinivibrionales bacterium]|nr:AAA family ATPase [Chitinivibrionales bacterium]
MNSARIAYGENISVMIQFDSRYTVIQPVSDKQHCSVSLVRFNDKEELYYLKLYKETHAGPDSTETLRRFKKELDILTSFDHPHINKVYGSYFDGRNSGLVFPYREGRTLDSMLTEGVPLSIEDATAMILQLLDALEYMHVRGILHCDINPNNLFLDAEKSVQLLDFDSAMTEEEVFRLAEGQMIGTPPYISLEQTGFTEFKIDHRSDIFCAAVILYRTLSGTLPFGISEDTVNDVLFQILKEEITPIKNIPALFNKIIIKALKVSPEDRYQTATGFSYDLSMAMKSLAETLTDGFIIGSHDDISAINRVKVFVGRDEEIETLQRAYSHIQANSPSAVLLHGISGIGKTQIVLKFKSKIENRTIFISAKCNRFSLSYPYAIIRHIIVEYLSSIATSAMSVQLHFKQTLNNRLVNNSGILISLVPELREHFTEIFSVDEVEKEKEADRIIHILQSLLQILGEIAPTIVFIDDFQWIDQPSFRIVTKSLMSPRLLFILSFRTEKNDQELYLHGTGLLSLGIPHLIAIQPFTQQEILEFIHTRFGNIEQSYQLAEFLIHRTDKTPFALTEVIRYLVNNSFLYPTELGWQFDQTVLENLPSRLDSVSLILTKLDNLKQQQRHYLVLSSIIEGKFDHSIIRSLGKFEPSEADRIVNQLVSSGFLIRHSAGIYSFAHDKIKEAIGHRLDNTDRLSLNERIGHMYESMMPQNKEYVFNAAECYLKSRNAVKSIELCYKAAQYAAEEIAFDVSIKYFKHSLMLISQHSGHNGVVAVDSTELQLAFGKVLMLNGRNVEALHIFLELIHSPLIRSMQQQMEIRYTISTIYHNMGDFKQAIRYFCKTLGYFRIFLPTAFLPTAGHFISEIFLLIAVRFFGLRFFSLPQGNLNNLAVRTLNKLSYSLYFENFVLSILSHLKSLKYSRTLNACMEKVETYALHSVALYQLFLRRRSFKYIAKALILAKKIRRKDAVAFAQYIYGIILYFNSRWKESESNLLASIQTLQTIGDSSGQISSYEHLWRISLMRGLFDTAMQTMHTTLNLCLKNKERHFYLSTKSALYYISVLKKLPFDQSALAEIDTTNIHIDSYLTRIHIESFLLKADLLRYRLTEAYHRLTRLEKLTRKKAANYEYELPLLSDACELYIIELCKRQNGKRALEGTDAAHLKRLGTFIRTLFIACLSYPAYRGNLYRHCAWYCAFKKHAKSAHYFFKKALNQHHKLDMLYEKAKTHREYAYFLESRNMPGEAKDHFFTAYELFTACGAQLEADHLCSTLSTYHRSKTMASTERITSSRMIDVHQIRFDMLHEMSSLLMETEDVNKLLRQILTAMIKTSGAQYAWLFLENNNNLPMKTICVDSGGMLHKKSDIPYSRKIIKQVQQQRKTVLVRDVSLEQTVTDTDDDTVRISAIKSVLCVPLLHLNNYQGCIYLGNNTVAGIFSDESKKVSRIIAAQASVLIENISLMRQSKTLTKNLRKKVREQTKDIQEKHNQLQTTNLKLIDSERMRKILTDTIVHDIKNYAAGIEANLNVLTRKTSQDMTLAKTMAMINNSCTDIINLSLNLLDIGKIEESGIQLRRERITIDKIIEIVDKEKANIVFEERNIHIILAPGFFDKSFTLEADEHLFTRVLQNLFSNAAKYAPKNGRVVLSFESRDEEDIVCFFCSGSPIPENDKMLIFDKYSYTTQKRTQYSKGLGLFFCKLVAQAHGGNIWLETDETGNYFKISFKRGFLQQVADEKKFSCAS